MKINSIMTIEAGGPGSGRRPYKTGGETEKQSSEKTHHLAALLKEASKIWPKESYWVKLSEHGREGKVAAFTPEEQKYLKSITVEDCKIGQCYMNAQRIASWTLNNKDLKYMEGLVTVHSIPIDHAYLEYHGKVYDPTLLKMDGTSKTKTPPGEYFGIEIPGKLVLQHMLDTEMYAPLSQSHDLAIREKVWGKPSIKSSGTSEGAKLGWESRERKQVIEIPTPPTKPLLPGQTTEEAWKNKNGEWDAKREAWHQAVAEKAIEGKVASGHREATILGGGTASGKTTLSKQLVGDNKNTVRVDADEVKLVIPEYEKLKQTDPKTAAGIVHEEASYIAKLTMAKSVARGLDVIYDATSTGKGALSMLQKLASEDYKVHVLFADVPIEVAKVRAIDRANDPTNKAGYGRIIPDELMENSHRLAAANFMKMKDMPEAHAVHLYDTTGKTPKVVYARMGQHGRGIITSPGRWEQYKIKAGV